MSLIIPDEILHATRMSTPELKQEIAVMLFQKEKLTLGQASQLADMGLLEFQQLLGSRQISIHYDIDDFEQDLKTLDELSKVNDASVTHLEEEFFNYKKLYPHE